MKKIIHCYVGCLLSFITFTTLANAAAIPSGQQKLQALENNFSGKIGVYAIDTNTHHIIAYRAHERFPMQSTMKLISVAALLSQGDKNSELLEESVPITKNDLITWYPITGKYLNSSMTFASLAAAAIIYSDNAAVNLITKKLGGPDSITYFARSMGNKTFNLTHYEGHLNTNPGVKDDTVTPYDMALSVKRLTLGHVLSPSKRDQLVRWMRDSTTGYQRIRAGMPIGWIVADKTGSGDYGVANDIGILWSPACKPIILAIYTVCRDSEAKGRDDIVAATTRVVMERFAQQDSCFNVNRLK